MNKTINNLRISPLTALFLLAAVATHGGNLQWDNNPATPDAEDGSGTWNLLDSNWTNGTANVVWDNNSTAVFGNGNGTPGSGVFTVSLAGNTSVTNITFKNAGAGNSYLIDNPNATLTLLTGGTVLDTITVNPGVSAEINTRLATSGSATASVRTIGGGNLKLSGGTAADPSSIYFLSARNGATMELAGNMVCSNNLMASGGTLVLSGTNLVLNAFYTGDSGNGGNDLNVVNVTDGVTTLNLAAQMYMGKKNTTNSVNISGGSLVFPAGNSKAIYLACDFNGNGTVSNIVSELNISGTGLFDTGSGSGKIFRLANGNNTLATVNLDGGTFATARQIATGTIGTHTSIFNFNGGLLLANADQEDLMVGADSPSEALSGVYVRNGGAIFDTTGGNLGIMHDLLHSTNVSDSATDGGVTVSGVGALTLGGNNTYTGPTVVKSGAVCMASTTSVPGYLSGSVTVSNGAAFGVRLGGDSSISQPDFDTIISSSTIFNAAGKNVAIAVSGNGGPVTDISTIGNLTGSRGLVKVGAGTLQMLGSYTYTGPTIVSGGKLQLVSGVTTPPSGGYVINPLGVIQVGDGFTPGSGDLGVNTVTNYGGKLTFNRPDSYVVTNLIKATAGGLFNIVAGSSVTFSNSGSYWADTFPQNGTMVFDLGAGGTVSASGRLQSSAFGATTEIDWVSGSGNFTDVALADNAAGVSTLNVSGGNLYFNPTNQALIGVKGTAYVNVSNGTLTFGGTNDVKLGGDLESAATGNGTLTIIGGQCAITNAIPRLILGENSGATGTLNLYGGTLLSAGTISGGAGSSSAMFSGGTLKAGASNNNWMTNLTSALVSTNGLIVDDGSYAVAINQALLHDPALGGADGGLTKKGTGVLYLNGVNTFSGTTVVSNGTLLIKGNSLGVTNTTTVVSGATFGGNGTLGGPVTFQAGAFATNVVGSPMTIAAPVALNGNTMNVSTLSTLGAGSYLLMTNTAGGITGSFAAVIVGGAGVSGAPSIVTTANAVLLQVGVGLPTTPTNVTFSVTGGNTLNLSWPSSYTGWQLQSNSVSLTSPGDWFLVPGSTATNAMSFGVDKNKSKVFFRLRHP